MKKILIMIVLATAMLLASAGNAFAFGGHRGGGHYGGGHYGGGHYGGGYYGGGHYGGGYYGGGYYRHDYCRGVIVVPPRAGIIIGPFVIIGF
jgi:uncharacterized membrane protein